MLYSVFVMLSHDKIWVLNTFTETLHKTEIFLLVLLYSQNDHKESNGSSQSDPSIEDFVHLSSV